MRKNISNTRKLVAFIFIVFCQIPYLWGADLSVTNHGKKEVFTTEMLLQHPKKINLTLESVEAYGGRKMSFLAIPTADLFVDLELNKDAVIQFTATDGFSGAIPRNRLLNTDGQGATSYVAIEDPQKPWPELKTGKESAGPFFLVWKNPEKSSIAREEWPYKLASFEVLGTLQSEFPKIFPGNKYRKTHAIQKGFLVFQRNCFVCHTINGQGRSQIGPDLNVPLNPTEYFRDVALRQLIRNPQSVRSWKNSRMVGFGEDAITKKDLDNLISYLKHMSKRKSL